MQIGPLAIAAILSGFANAASNSTSSYSTPSVSGTAVCTYSKGFTATADADIQKIDNAGCATFDGDIVIKGDDITAVSFNSIQQIQGSLTVDSATQLKTFVSNSLIAVSETLSLVNLTILEDLELPNLFKVGTLHMQALPAVGVLSFSAFEQVSELQISDCAFSNITGLVMSTASVIDINNNGNLESLEFPNLHDVSSSLGITYNSKSLDVTFDNLIWANNITFRSVNSVTMDNLTAVNNSLGYFNNSIESISLEQLTNCGALTIASNDELTEVEVPELTKIDGAFQIMQNEKLESITGFDSLQTVGGALTFNGDFTNASLPKIKSIRGGATINSTGDLDCSPFNKLSKQGAIQGKGGYKCASAHSSTSAKASKSSGGSDDDSDSGSTKSSSSKAGAEVLYTSFGSIVAAFALSLF